MDLRPRPKVLYITNLSPYPPLSGGQRREYEVLRRLTGSFEVHLMLIGRCLPDDAGVAEAMDRIGTASMTLVQAAPSGRRLPPRMEEHYSPDAKETVGRLLTRYPFDLIHVECFFHMQSLPDGGTPPVVLFEENIEYDLQRQYEVVLGKSFTADWRQCKAIEEAAWRQACAVGVNSEDDLMHIAETSCGAVAPMMVPLGADHLVNAAASGRGSDGSAPPVVGFIGNLRWFPSRDATSFLIDEVWPIVSASVPRARLRIVASGVDDELRSAIRAAPGVSLFENVARVADVLEEVDVFCCPLRTGGGVKMKVYEALAAGCAIVSTPVGAQGLRGDVRAALRLVEATAHECAAAVTALLTDLDALRVRSELSLRAARMLATWSTAAAAQEQLWRGALAGRDNLRRAER